MPRTDRYLPASEQALAEAQRGLESALARLCEAQRAWWSAPMSELVQARYAIVAVENEVARARERMLEVVRALHEAELQASAAGASRWSGMLARLESGRPALFPHAGDGADA